MKKKLLSRYRLSLVLLIILTGLFSVIPSCSGGGGGGGTTPRPIENEIGPNGGTLTFSNGVKLVFPPGAVDAPTVITIENLPAAQIDAILSNPAMVSTRTKRFLGGFSAKPEGLTFKVPIEAWIPVRVLNPYEIPVPLTVRLNEGTYRYSSSSLEYDGSLQMVKLKILHFSDETIGGLSPEQFDLMCTSCGTFQSSVCEAFDPLQPACCMLASATRKSCASAGSCDFCCREKKIIVKTSDVEITAGDCVILGSDVKITYPECPGSPTETDSISEKTCDVTLVLAINPPVMDLPVHQTGTFSATVTGTSATGIVLFRDVQVLPIWQSEQPSIAGFVDLIGNIRGNATSLAPVTIRATLSEVSGVEATASVNVFCQGCTLEIQAATTQVRLGDSLNLMAIVRDSQGAVVNVSPGMLSWANTDPAVAFLNETTGRIVTLTTVTVGTTVVSATYTDVHEQHSAFLGITVMDKYMVIDLGTLAVDTSSRAYDINNGGKVVGRSWPVGNYIKPPSHAFLSSGGVMTDLGGLHYGEYYENYVDCASYAYGVNDSDQVVGMSLALVGGVNYHYHAFLYSGGSMIDLGILNVPGQEYEIDRGDSRANGINASGQVAGAAQVGGPAGWNHAFIYSGGVMTDLGTLGGGSSEAYDINDSGQVVGYSNLKANVSDYHAFLYSNGVMTDLGSLGWNSCAISINASGQIVGWSSYTSTAGSGHAFLYSSAVMTDLGTLGGVSSEAYDINDSGQVVGWSNTADGVVHAFLWINAPTEGGNGVMTDLNTLIDPALGWTLIEAQGINDLGQIVGYGWHNGVTRAFLLSH